MIEPKGKCVRKLLVCLVALLGIGTIQAMGTSSQQDASPKAISQTAKPSPNANTRPSLPIQKPALSAPYAYLEDFTTGTVLFSKNATSPMVPSSMTKLMTLYEVFSALKEGRLCLTDNLPISKKAGQARGSRSFLEAGDRIPVEDLIRCIIVHSGNDACIVAAQALGGSEEAFAEMMTTTAQRLGAQSTVFKNATGWPEEGHYSSATDLALFARHLLLDFPQYYSYFSEKEFFINGILQRNRNTLLWRNIGVDGLKTGRTDAGGYGIVVSAVQKGQRLIAVINGCNNDKERAKDAETLLRWGFSEFVFYKIADKGEPVTSAEVWLGDAPTVGLVAHQSIGLVVPRRDTQGIKVEVVYKGPLETPIKAGDRVAVLYISVPGRAPVEYPLFANSRVDPIGALKRVQAAISYLLFGAKTS
ncbi:MAG: D-alanyl-D-alanine carboxypeptidase [Holosporales bacterium]|jgi:D-alanyl-D-alanine carboxypeptidase (penicillin-binding protein 5/6)|nr:D-alanyl-D-alanine carboxypeptidase [Holosporales bacterium]